MVVVVVLGVRTGRSEPVCVCVCMCVWVGVRGWVIKYITG